MVNTQMPGLRRLKPSLASPNSARAVAIHLPLEDARWCSMMNATIRKKRLRAERIVDDFMRMPRRITLGVTDYSETSWEELQQHKSWLIPVH